MSGTTAGILAAVAVIAAFVIGSMIDFDSGDGVFGLDKDGPAEQLGEKIDQKLNGG